MKRSLYVLGSVCLGVLLLASCNPSTGYSSDDLIGVWRAKTTKTSNPDGYYYVVFSADKADEDGYRLGKEWDEGDDVKEEEAQLFKWKLEVKDLTQIHWMEINQTWGVPKYYTVTLLTNTSLSFTNNNRTYTFEKVAEAEVSPATEEETNTDPSAGGEENNSGENPTEGSTEGSSEGSTEGSSEGEQTEEVPQE